MSILGNGQPKPAGTWDYYGKLDPQYQRYPLTGYHSFSIGVFQWKQTKTGQLTKGKSVKRFKAPMHAPHEAYHQAKAFIETQNNTP